MSQETNPGFSRAVRGARTCLFHAEGGDQIRAAMMDGAGCEPASTEGRGTVMRFPYLDGHGLLRKNQRGGVVRLLLRNRYVLDNRALREFRLHVRLYMEGLRVPKPLGVCWERHGVCFSGAVATLEVESLNLQQYLRSASVQPENVLRQCGCRIREMHDLGVFHADLQVRNILVGPYGPLLIDFDNASVHKKLGRWRRSMNLLRLRRSFLKNGIALSHFEALYEGYGGLAIPWILDAFYRIKGILSGRL